jgi:glycerophosphoryl diester phosphodiesterase
VADVHGAGLYALGWDAQSADDISRLLDLGLDGIYSDHVGRMMAGVKARLGPRG